MSKSKAKKAVRKPANRRKSGVVSRVINRALRFAGRIHWPSITLRTAALAALIVVEVTVATVVGHMADDEVTATLLVVSAGLAGLGVVLGPSVAMSVRPSMQRLAWFVVAGCIAISVWNFSTTLHNAQALAVSNAITTGPTYQDDVIRLTALNRRIDSLGDERNADAALMNYLAERDRLQERLDHANPEPVMFAAFPYWLKAGLFHLLVAGFSAGFAIPIKRRPTRRASNKSAQAPRGQTGFPAVVNF